MQKKHMIAQWVSKKRYLHRSIREFLIKTISPEFFNGHRFETDFFGLKWQGKTDNHIDYQVLMRGAYEKFMLFFMRDVITSVSNTETVFIDVGANIGNHSLFMSKYASAVHSFEPYKPVRDILEKKIAVNQIHNIVVHPVGLSDMNTDLSFYSPENSNLGTGSFEQQHSDANRPLELPLKVVIGDQEISENNISGIGVIKIDVEGHEPKVIKGLAKTLEINRPMVIFESSPLTRDSLKNFENMACLFPENYSFYIFSVRNKKNGQYRLSPLNTLQALTHNEIIAVPKEKQGLIV